MYHPGKVVKVLAGKESNDPTQAVLEMWDDNLLTFLVDSRIASEVKEGDIVLVDYRSVTPANPNSHVIVKILHGGDASGIWRKYKESYEKKGRNQRMHDVLDNDEYLG
ncbi:MAG: hypothetical protein HYW25_02635 [Candidatus Aenigmarchaeota archaeon]|nr:hypothetical protein [Candidatus Aenigmarchaeota archaeon]